MPPTPVDFMPLGFLVRVGQHEANIADTDGDWQKRSSPRGKFTKKREFHYDSAGDVYHCPAGCELTFAYQEHDALGRGYREYCGRECGDCPLRSQCTEAVRGRTLKRYVGEEFRDWAVGGGRSFPSAV
jgi:hypothetical protein